MAEDLTRPSSAAKPVAAQQPLVGIDLNAPPPQDTLEVENRFEAQSDSTRTEGEVDFVTFWNRSIGLITEYQDSGDDEDLDDSDEDEEFLDIDNMSYEELLALGERIGKQSRGLHQDVISALPCHTFVQTGGESECNKCVICCYDFEEGTSVLTLPCKHPYHSECIKSWLHIQKNCPICNAEVTS